MNTAARIEALLFYTAEPVSYETLCDMLGISQDECASAIIELEEQRADTGIRLVRDRGSVELATAPEAHDLIEAYQERQHTKRLGKAGLETLTIILYNGPISRREIDYIRGVNSTHILRNLTIRGLIEKSEATGPREVTYAPTCDLLRWIGVSHQSELPEYETTRQQLTAITEQSHDT